MNVSITSVRRPHRRPAALGALVAALALTLGMAAPAMADGPELVTNGDFASPQVAHGANAVSSVQGWTLLNGRVDISSDYTVPAGSPAGTQSADLAVNTGGVAIEQAVATVAGETYTLSFQLAGNPACGRGTKTGSVSVNGTQVHAISFAMTGQKADSMGWVDRSYTFTAAGTSTTINFTGTNTSNCGPVVTNVSLVETTTPGVPMANLQIGGAALFGLAALGGVVALARRRGTVTTA